MLVFWLQITLFFSISPIECQTQTIEVGLLFVKDVDMLKVPIGYRTSASAILIGEERIRNAHLLDNYQFNYHIEFDECSETLGAGKATQLIDKNKVDVIFGPTCNQPAIAVSALATYYNIPVFLWGLTSSSVLSNTTRFPTTLSLSVNSYGLATAVLSVMDQFNWKEFVFVYSNDFDGEKCESLKNDVQTVTSQSGTVVLSYLYQIGTITIESLRAAVRAIKTRGRIIVACFATGTGFKKGFMQATMLENANDSSYVYILAETNSRGFIIQEAADKFHYAWEGDVGLGIDLSVEQTHDSFMNVLFLVDNMGMDERVTTQFLNFTQQVIVRMKDPPFNCIEDCSDGNYSAAASYAGQLADSFYAYAVALNKTLQSNPADYRNGALIMKNIGMTFEGVGSGIVTIDPETSRRFEIYFIGLNSSKLPQTQAKLIMNRSGMQYVPYYSDESVLWNGGARPLAKPICGFTGTECPTDFLRDYLIYTIIAAAIVIFAIILAISGIIYTIRMKQEERKREDKLWQVDFLELQKIQSKTKTEASQRSFASGPSTSTKITIESQSESSRVCFYNYRFDIVAALKYEMRIQLMDDEKIELRKLRNMEHDNLNKFIGLCMNSQPMYSIWKYCSRGSLSDVIERSSMQMDGFFKYSLIRDIAEGIGYIQNSFLVCHGHLNSHCCLIDDRWQVKISDYGLLFLRQFDKVQKKEKLWYAPEVLFDESAVRTKEGDIYSFAIICSEILTKTSAYDLDNRKEKADEIIYQIKKGGMNPMRPSLEMDDTSEVSPSLIHLIRDCWTEKPSERPTINEVKSILRGMSNDRKANLMDHVFNILETYASNLEEEVSERTKELVEEKKKSDILLYRMLPRSVAEKLKLGQVVEPETFESVTIFFSDVVKFTVLASKCSPLQVVTLLNDLYTIFDGIIEQHDVYKVETIGDGYLCVSGLPHRNGNEHCRHIANMALGFLSSIQTFRISHLPAERINLRVGINCGSVVAGVVGLTMPRFCLFGDAVNTASRMESNGKPGQIHVSAEANRMLTQTGAYRTESRGEVIIKGKGVMETYWLLGPVDGSSHSTVHSVIKEVPHREPSAARSVTPRDEEVQGLYSQYKQDASL